MTDEKTKEVSKTEETAKTVNKETEKVEKVSDLTAEIEEKKAKLERLEQEKELKELNAKLAEFDTKKPIETQTADPEQKVEKVRYRPDYLIDQLKEEGRWKDDN